MVSIIMARAPLPESGLSSMVGSPSTQDGSAPKNLKIVARPCVRTSRAPLARINGLGTVWLEAAIPEAQAGLVTAGMTAQARFAAYPSEKFAGMVIAVLPETTPESHTLRVRVELQNPHGRFKPGMFVQLRLENMQRETTLVVPSEAVIRSGARNVVIAALEGNRFQPVEVTTGREVDGRTTILKGLVVGQQVVSSGQFLIDSEASLKGVLARMEQGSPDTSGSGSDKADAAMQSGKMGGVKDAKP